ncbi:H-NS family nucleoid-associated regulatory protein [Massilia sp. DWR3-1-1]
MELRPVCDCEIRNQDDASQTWSGRRRQPLWIKAWLAEGKRMDDLGV